MVADGIYYAVALAAGGGLVTYLTRPLYGVPLFLVAAFCLYFFRDPDRVVPSGPVAVSPADGKIVSIRREDPQRTRIGIFMNIFDVHVNRAPISGEIADIHYTPGRFLIASREDASLQNEQNSVTIAGTAGPIVFNQIAGPDCPAYRVPQEDRGKRCRRANAWASSSSAREWTSFWDPSGNFKSSKGCA